MEIRVATTDERETEAALAALAEGLAGDGPPDFVSVHHSPAHAPEAVAAGLAPLGARALHGGSSCLGVMSGAGALVDGGTGIGALAIRDPGGDFGTGMSEAGGDARAAAAGATRAALADAGRPGEAPDLVWLGSVPGAEEAVLDGIADVVGPHTPVIGGSAADNAVAGGWSVLCGGRSSRTGVVVSALFPSGGLAFAYQSGYAPAGPRGVATRAEGRRLHEIDGRPAADVYAEWSGLALPRPGGAPAPILSASTLAPLGHVAGEIKAVDLHLLAHPAAVRGDGTLDLFADIAEGTELWQMTGSADSLVERAGRVAGRARGGLPRAGADVSGALVIYCGGSMLAIRERMGEVAAGIDEALGGAPFLGLFTFGEQGALPGGLNHHANLMISCVCFGG